MKIYTIHQKPSGTGSIYDLASLYFDREIKFPANHYYAVVLAAYYGTNLYTVHRTAHAAISKSNKTEQFHWIIDADGNRYDIDWDRLAPTGETA